MIDLVQASTHVLFALAGASLVSSHSTSAIACALVLAFWISLGTMDIDLHLDVRPFVTSSERVRSCAIDYVPSSSIGSTTGSSRGSSASPSGRRSCGGERMCRPGWSPFRYSSSRFCSSRPSVDPVLVPSGIVERPLPLPMAKNRYAAHRPIWAWFFWIIHVAMAVSLAGGIAALHGALSPAS